VSERAFERASPRRIVGLAAVACVACCIGPILGVLGAIAALGLVASLLFGVGAVLVAALAVAALVVVRHRRAEDSSAYVRPVPVELGRRGR
jgi:fatty acid desaturase